MEMNLSGDLRIYSAPKALLRHIEWSLNTIFEEHVTIEWMTQPLSAGTYACEINWRARKPRASKIASTLKSWHFIRFDVREFPTEGGEGVLYRCTPDLGLHQAVTASTGDVMIHENRLVSAIGSKIGDFRAGMVKKYLLWLDGNLRIQILPSVINYKREARITCSR